MCSRVKCMSRSFTSLSPSCAAGDERCTHSKMPKAFGKCFMKYFHILATVNQLHSHVSQVLFRLCFSLLVKVNDLDSGFETRFHYFLRSASYSVTSLHYSLSFQISHVHSQSFLCHSVSSSVILSLIPHSPIHPPSNRL